MLKVHFVPREVLDRFEGETDWKTTRSVIARTANGAVRLFQTAAWTDAPPTPPPKKRKGKPLGLLEPPAPAAVVPATLWLVTPDGVAQRLAEGRINEAVMGSPPVSVAIDAAFDFPGLAGQLDMRRTGVVIGG